MIQLLNRKYQQTIAYFFLLVFYTAIVLPVYAGGSYARSKHNGSGMLAGSNILQQKANKISKVQKPILTVPPPRTIIPQAPKFIGGPSQPEMSSFKSVSTDNMVNLFTGDFNYNIPLLDVGGYPVNIYYDGNIGMEQEASWVGLGWNINPGSISRNMRGIPDDFDGTDTMVEQQNIKPNITYGGSVGADIEICGVKNFLNVSLGTELGASVNNYLGPALDLKLKGGLNFTLSKKTASEKELFSDSIMSLSESFTNLLSAGVSGSLDLSSRDGATLSGSVSLTKKLFLGDRAVSGGLSASTSYNSRVGIKNVQISGQASLTAQQLTGKWDDDIWWNFHAETRDRSISENLFSSTISFARPSYVPTIRMPMTNTAWSGHFQIGGALFGLYGSGEAEVYEQTSQITNVTQQKPLVGYMYYQNSVNNPDAVMDFTRLQDKEVTSTTPVISAPQYTYDVFSIQGEGTGGTVRAYRTDLGYVRDNQTSSSDNSVGIGVDVGIPGHFGGNFNIIKTPTVVGNWVGGNNLDGTMNFQQGMDLHQLVYLRNPGESTVLDANALSSTNNIGGTDLVRFTIGGTQANPTIGGLPPYSTTVPELQHFPLSGNLITPIVNSVNPTTSSNSLTPATAVKRSQVVTFLTACEAARAGLDKEINNYSPGLAAGNILSYTQIPRVGGYRKGHHISQINVTESDGKRYVYGLPVYNTTQTDFTFSITGVTSPHVDDAQFNLQSHAASWMTPTNSFVTNTGINNIDGYYQSTTTPAYAHSFLLTGLLSPDYVDVTGDGITEDDLGDAVKFNYSLETNTDGSEHRWRTPLTGGTPYANLNVGNRSETKDDKGIVSYGEREQWYLHSIESKTMVAIFTLGTRHDGKGADGSGAPCNSLVSGGCLASGGTAQGTVNTLDNTVQLLDHIDLYNKADLKANGLTGANAAKPIKTVHFVYNYSLCQGTPDNPTTGEGKLTLQSIYFTFNGEKRLLSTGQPDLSTINRYQFSYTNSDGTGNPSYAVNSADRWGTFKQNPGDINTVAGALANPGGLTNKDYPYSFQPNNNTDQASLNTINTNAGAWALKNILLPSGGQIAITYESDTYAYVQNMHAQQMMQVVGFNDAQPVAGTNSTWDNNLYELTNSQYALPGVAPPPGPAPALPGPPLPPVPTLPGTGQNAYDNMYVYIQVPVGCTSQSDVVRKYLAGLNSLSQLAFKYSVVMPKGEEYLTSYATIATDANGNFICGVTSNSPNIIWLQLTYVNGYSPLTLTTLEYLRQQLPGQAFPGYDMSSFNGGVVSEINTMLTDMLNGLGELFSNPINSFRLQSMGRSIGQYPSSTAANPSLKCFVRLNTPSDLTNSDGSFNPAGCKYGGGSRVKQITLKDNWDKMTNGQYSSVYGQVYDYTTTETQSDGNQHTISSGVASYEPSIGGEENPFTSIMQYENELPLGPASYGSVEMPILDAFFPAPTVGYSKVTVRSLADQNAITSTQKIKSAIGRQVTEFYTAKDFPVSYDYTPFDGSTDVQEHDAELLSFWHKSAFDSRALSQGFIVTTNDMHGKMKSQASYAANNDNNQISYTENFYTNTGANGTNDKFNFVNGINYGANNGLITPGNMGIDVELMTDAREMDISSSSKEFQVQVDLFPIYLPFWLPFPWYVGGTSQGIYRAVTTTKIINYHSVVSKVLVVDKGSKVTTENLLRDQNTGEVIVTKTNNEFKQPVYTTTYPAYWAYSGMGPAYQNIDAVFSDATFVNGVMNASTFPSALLESGDELLILSATHPTDQCNMAIESPLPSVLTNGIVTTQGVDVIWAFDQTKTSSPLTPTPLTHNFIFIDSAGNPYTNSTVSFRIIRSGKRNLLGDHLQAVTNMLISPIPVNPDSYGNKYLAISSTNNVVNASAIEYKEKWQTDQDEINAFVNTSDGNCGTVPTADCNPTDAGFYYENINPYRKGLLGNFRPDRNLVYYAGRVETSPSNPTNLPLNGFLDNSFALYWSFSTAAGTGMQPLQTRDANSSSNWVFKSKTTRVNARGLELETIDALNINTMAQYGYNKTLPTAIANNAAYPEAAFEGFEDYQYDNSLKTVGYVAPCANKQHIDFTSMLNSTIGGVINTTAPPSGPVFNAHTGKYVMAINAGQTATKTFAVGANNNTDFALGFGTGQPPGFLNQTGLEGESYSADVGTITANNYASNTPFQQIFSGLTSAGGANGFTVGNFYVQDQYSDNNLARSHGFGLINNYYIQVPTTGTYTFNLTFGEGAYSFFSSQGAGYGAEALSLSVSLYNDIQGYNNDQTPAYTYTLNNATTGSVSFHLCAGIYFVSTYASDDVAMTIDQNIPTGRYTFTKINVPCANWSCFDNVSDAAGSVYTNYNYGPISVTTSPALTCYQSLNAAANCTQQYTTPIVGTTDMQQPSFAISSTKQMLFSAWVREDGLPANQSSYNNNQVQLQFVDANNNVLQQPKYDGYGNALNQTTALVTLKPTGPIIDGWQRYEGYFAAPTSAANLNMSFVNSSTTNKIYFDDIRIQPFNADMKSYVYDPITQRLVAQLDANNYASFYEYDEEGTLIRTKAETIQGIKTINETRSAKQKNIQTFQ